MSTTQTLQKRPQWEGPPGPFPACMMTTKKTMNDLKTPGIASEGAQEPSQDLHATPLPLHPFIARLMDLQAVASPQHRQVLEVLLKDPFHGAMWGVEEMAAKAGTSVTSVVRMAKLLGFPAFTEFRQALKQAVEVRVESLERKTLEVSGTEENMLSEVVQRDGQHLQLLLQDITQARMEAVVERIRTARQRLVFGLGSAGIMAEVLAHQLTQAGCTAHAPSGPMYGSMVANLREEDLLIVVSMSPYHRETSEAARFSKERGVPVIVFADSMESPDVRFGDPVLRIPGEDLLTGASLAPFVMLGHALAMVALGRDEAALAERRKAAERISGAFTMERRRSGAWQGPYPPARKP